ncbi:MAG: BrnT family toxin [Bacteroidota bacterium]
MLRNQALVAARVSRHVSSFLRVSNVLYPGGQSFEACGRLSKEEKSCYVLPVEFEWDPKKAAKNLRKHRVSFNEAATVFGDLLGTTVPDPDHSLAEDRYITVGVSSRRRLVMVAHTEHGERIRIISARELTRAEREAYEEETKK